MVAVGVVLVVWFRHRPTLYRRPYLHSKGRGGSRISGGMGRFLLSLSISLSICICLSESISIGGFGAVGGSIESPYPCYSGVGAISSMGLLSLADLIYLVSILCLRPASPGCGPIQYYSARSILSFAFAFPCALPEQMENIGLAGTGT